MFFTVLKKTKHPHPSAIIKYCTSNENITLGPCTFFFLLLYNRKYIFKRPDLAIHVCNVVHQK